MKVKDGFLLRQVAGAWMAVPVGERLAQVRGLISLNETGASIWRLLEQGCRTEEELVSALCEEYGEEREAIAPAVESFTAQLRAQGLLEE